jgi:hypothetical protein
MSNKLDLTGQRFGRLTVMYEAEPIYTKADKKKIVWHCKCDCGNEKDVPTAYLRTGTTKSCGCFQKEEARRLRQLNNHNEYDLDSQEYGIGYTNKKVKFLFDKEDYDKIKDYCWFIHSDGYCYAKIPDGSGKSILMHDLIMGQRQVDHKNHDKTDNRKNNLRIAEDRYSFDSYNQMNKGLQSNNKSGHSGVYWSNRDKIWESYISYGCKRYYLGRYSDFDDAVKAREEAEKKYFGEWSFDNSQKIAKERNLVKEAI